MRHLNLVFVVLQMSMLVRSGDPPGHMQPLGSHMPPIEVEVRDTVPDPIEFFNDYIKPGKPVVMKGAANDFQNYKTWKDDEYLKNKYGKWLTNVEVGKYEGAVYGRYIYIPFRYFLKNYKKKEYYLIADIVPENPMRDEITLPKAMACGGYAEMSFEALILFSSGSTQSALHWDAVENMHCVLDGTKEWIMYDRVLIDRLPLMENYDDYSAVDCRKVDMYKYPIFQELPWHYANLSEGDCLYVPYSWPHNVRSNGNKRSMAQAVWFGPVHHLNTSDCPDDLSQLPNTVPLGRRRMSNLANIRNSLFFEFGSKQKISKEEFIAIADSMNATATFRAYKALDQNRDGYITWNEIENLDEEINLFSEVFVYRSVMPYNEEKEDDIAHNEL